MRKRTVIISTGTTAFALAVGVVGGAAFAQVPILFSPAGVSASEGVSSEPMPTPTYEKNRAGLTFGSAADAPAPEFEPELIQAQASNGKEGYVRKAELDQANGSAAAAEFTSPEQALRWQESQPEGPVYIPVYDVDGVTVIGEFPVGSEKLG